MYATAYHGDRWMFAAIRKSFAPIAAMTLVCVLLFATVRTAHPAERGNPNNGVVKLKITTHKDVVRIGSGFLVRLDDDRAYILTAAHVVDGARAISVFFNARRLDATQGTAVGPEHWDRRGLALVVVPASDARSAGAHPLRLSSERPPGTGTELRLIGHARTVSDWSSLYGRVAAHEGKALKVQTAVNEGSSGGPVLHHGQVVGVVVEGIDGIAIIQPVAVIWTYLDGHKILPGETFLDCDVCPEMVVIPLGSFRMGSPAGEIGRAADEGPVRSVRISEPFALSEREVTVGQFRAFVTETGYHTEAENEGGCYEWTRAKWKKNAESNWRAPGFAQGDDHPVVCVSKSDAREYLKWLSEKTKRRYRLPSEAEWEYAARAGTTTSRFWGESPDHACEFANVADESLKSNYPEYERPIHGCDDRHVHTAPVGTYTPNGFGLLDMLGNVREWTDDCWNDSYREAPNDGSTWTKGDCNRSAMRGGSWYDIPDYTRSADRYRNDKENRDYDLGFRPAVTL